MGKGRAIAKIKVLLALVVGLALPVSAFGQEDLQANTKWIKGSYEYGFLYSDVIRFQ